MCGLQVDVEDEHVKLIRGDRDDVWSKGYLCPKGTTLGHLHHDPDRLREPMVRDGDTWREVTWDEAFARCEELIHGVLDRHGIAVGRPRSSATRSATASPSAATCRCSSGSRACRTSTRRAPIDQWPKNVSLHPHVREHVDDPGARHPAHRLPRSAWAATRRRRSGSLLACPDVLGELDGIRERGGKVVVDRPAPHRHRRPRRRVGADPARHRRRVPARDRATCSSPRGSIDLGALAEMVEGRRRRARARAPIHARGGRGVLRRPRRHDPPARPRVRGRADGRGVRPHRPLQPGVRHAGVVAGRRRQHPHRQLRPPGGLMWGKPIAWPMAWMAPTAKDGSASFGRWKSRVSRRARGARPGAGRRAWPRRSPRPATGQIKMLVHRRRQPGDQRARLRRGSRRRCPSSSA